MALDSQILSNRARAEQAVNMANQALVLAEKALEDTLRAKSETEGVKNQTISEVNNAKQQVVNSLSFPSYKVYVDPKFAMNTAPLFDNLDSAISYVRSQITEDADLPTYQVVISPGINLDPGSYNEYDPYSLYKEGIILQFSFSHWDYFIMYGADITNSELGANLIYNHKMPFEFTNNPFLLYNNDVTGDYAGDYAGYYAGSYYGAFDTNFGIGFELLQT